MELIPFDNDILSLELENPYREAYLEGDRTSLYYVARSIMNFQNLFGIIPVLKGKGTCSKLIIDMLLRMRKENMEDNSAIANISDNNNAKSEDIDPKNSTNLLSLLQRSKLNPDIDQLIIIDREADMITPLCTQLTYEGISIYSLQKVTFSKRTY